MQEGAPEPSDWSLGRNLNKHIGFSCSELSRSDNSRMDVAVRAHCGGEKESLPGMLLGILHCREFIYKIHGGIEGSGSSPGLGNCCT